MNKFDLINEIALKANVTNEVAEISYKTIIEIIIDSLENGDQIDFPNLGSFSIFLRPSSKGRNPLTSEIFIIPEKKMVHFKPDLGDEFSEAIYDDK